MGKNEPVVAFVTAVLIVTAAVGAVSLSSSPLPPFTESTTTTTETISCPTLNSTQASGNSTVLPPNFGPLLGNLSALSFVESIYSAGGNIAVSASLSVLNRSFTGPRPLYLVNVTLNEFSTLGGNQTQMGSVQGRVASNGTMISVERSSGTSVLTDQLTTSPLEFFQTFASVNSTASSYTLHRVNSTVATIGSTRMIVTNYEIPTLVAVELLEGCGSGASTHSMVAIVSNGTIQAGQVPGTDFTLITLISESYAFQYNSTSPTSIPPASISEKVTSFGVG